jgi:hypothetical protein
MSEQRLDDLAATLGRTRPALDDITRARIAGVLAAAARTSGPIRRPARHRRWAIGVAAVAVAVVILGLVVRDTGPAPTATPVTPMLVIGELPDGAMLSAVPGTAVRGQIGGTVLTVYGPGSAIRRGPRIIVDADTLVVDRASGDEPVELAVRSATIRVQHATFSVDSRAVVRVTVFRGEIILSCAGHDASQTVATGGSAACGAVRTAGGRPPASAPPAPGSTPTGAGSAASGAVLTGGPPRARSPAVPDPAPPAPRAAEAAVPRARPAGGSSILRPGLPPEATAAPASAADVATAAAPPDAAISSSTRPPPEPERRPAAPGPDPAGDRAARYAAVERLMVSDVAGARAALRALVAEAPGAPEAAPALLDLARLAASAGDGGAARAALDQLAAHPGAAALAMPATYLRCTLEQTDPARRACLAGFRAAFPDSPRDADVLARLAAATAGIGACDAALQLLVELKRLHPQASTAAALRAWNARCKTAAAR